ncbi:MAG TPA: endonuclease V, partial [Nitrospirota bacterium]
MISPEWPDNYKDAVALQERLRASVARTGRVDNLRLVAGADVSYSKGSDSYHACVVVLEYPAMTVVEESCVTAKST